MVATNLWVRSRYVFLFLLAVLLAGPAFAAGFDPASIFEVQCSGCHSVGRGVVVGPDLAGVTSRHPPAWLHSFIRSSQGMVKKGDQVAKTLFGKFGKVMPDHDFTDEQIDTLLRFIASGGPKPPARFRLARTATPAEVARGRALFTGAAPLAHGGPACSQCHSAGAEGGWRGMTLAADLTGVYERYPDAWLTRVLLEARDPLMVVYRDRPLTEDEAFALKAFLYKASRSRAPIDPLSSTVPPFFLGIGGSGIALWMARRGARRRPGADA
jgi:mono/diheme cytochrome c family protein